MRGRNVPRSTCPCPPSVIAPPELPITAESLRNPDYHPAGYAMPDIRGNRDNNNNREQRWWADAAAVWPVIFYRAPAAIEIGASHSFTLTSIMMVLDGTGGRAITDGATSITDNNGTQLRTGEPRGGAGEFRTTARCRSRKTSSSCRPHVVARL